MSPPVVEPRHCQWPPERFFWAVVDAPGFTRRGMLPAGVQAVVDDELPLPSADVHAVGVPVPGGRLLVCAALRSALGELGPAITRLTPESVPSLLGVEAAAGDLNVLVGPMEPVPIRRARARRHLLALTAISLCSALLALGLWRRDERWSEVGRQAREATRSLLASAAVPAPDQLSFELARWRSAARTAPSAPPDAAVALSALLSAWPERVASRPQAITVDASGITLAVVVDQDPGLFLGALRPPSGWVLEEPRLNTAGAVTRLNLRLRRSEGPS